MTGQQEIKREVTDLIEQAMVTDGRARIDPIVQTIISSWTAPTGPDADKWFHCASVTVRSIARQLARIQTPDVGGEDEDQQLVLPGYKKLHRYYPIDGEFIRVDLLTVSQAMDVMTELLRNKSGLDIHINELQRFIDEVLIPRGNGN